MSTLVSPPVNARYGLLAILVACFLWGTTGTVASYAPQLSSLAIGAFAMGIGGLLQTLLRWHPIRAHRQQLAKMKALLCLGALAIAVYPLAFYSSMRMSGVAIGTVVSLASAPFFSAILERLFSQKRSITLHWWFSFCVGVAGILLLVISEPSQPVVVSLETTQTWGIFLGLLAGATYALYAWVAKTMIDSGVDSRAAMGSLFGLASLILIPSLLFTGEHLFASLNNILVVTYMAIIPMFLGYIAFGYGLKFIDASRATLLTLFEPVVATFLAITLVGEHISRLGWCGLALIMLCLLLQSHLIKRPKRFSNQ